MFALAKQNRACPSVSWLTDGQYSSRLALQMGVDSNEFPLPEYWLARINHNKNGTCGLSSLKDQLPWDTAETSPIICPSEAETMGKSIERISVPEGKIFKRDKNTVHFFKGFLASIYSPLDTVANVAVFFPYERTWLSASVCILYSCDHF